MDEPRDDCSDCERAEVIAWPAPWDPGAACPAIFMAQGKLILVYHTNIYHPDANVSILPTIGIGRGRDHISIAKFRDCLDVTFGQPFPEYHYAHHLHRVGLEIDSAHLIVNSSRIQSLSERCAVTSPTDLSKIEKSKHFLLSFHDEVLECIASDVEFLQTHSRMELVYNWAAKEIRRFDE